jgi:uncharacterized RDD family membrane protein YckC
MLGMYAAVAAAFFLWRPRDFSFPSPSFALLLGLAGGLFTLYLTLSWVLLGRTYGDNVLGLRVISRKGDRLSLGVALLRAVLCVGLPYGLLWAAIDRHSRSVQDLLMRTTVIYDWIGLPPTTESRNGPANRPVAEVPQQPGAPDDAKLALDS